MIILDENIIASQKEQLKRWRIHFSRIGADVGHRGMNDFDEVIPLPHKISKPTFFTRDSGFYEKSLIHKKYCIVLLSVRKDEVADYILRFLRHSEFKTHAKRQGRVVRVSSAGIYFWQVNVDYEQFFKWI